MALDVGFGAGSILFVLIFAIGVAGLVFWIWALVDVVRSNFADNTMKLVWVLVILFTSLVGPLLWLIWGRNNTQRVI